MWRWVLAVIMMFFILAALYESWLLPFSVILALPFGMFGRIWYRLGT